MLNLGCFLGRLFRTFLGRATPFFIAQFSPVCGDRHSTRLHHLDDVNLENNLVVLELLEDGLHDVVDEAELAGLALLGAVENPGPVYSNVHRLLAS